MNWDWYKDNNTFKLFVHLLLEANVEDAAWMGVKVKRGQVVTSYNSLSHETGLTVSQLRTALRHLQKTGDISVNTTQFYTLITVENYGLYQGFEQFEHSEADTDRA